MKPNTLLVAFAAATTAALAQTPALQMGAMYQCAPTQVLKLLSCSADTCDVQIYVGGQPAQRVQPNRQKLTALLAPCHVQTPQEAQAIARAANQGDPNGFKVGDTVRINTWRSAGPRAASQPSLGIMAIIYLTYRRDWRILSSWKAQPIFGKRLSGSRTSTIAVSSWSNCAGRTAS